MTPCTAPMSPMTLDQFAAIWDAVAASYGQASSIEGAKWSFLCLMEAAPDLPYEAFLFGARQATISSRFRPTVADLLRHIFEADESKLPALPDIDPKYADSYQLGIYHRAEAEREKARQAAPPDVTRYRSDCRAALVAAGVIHGHLANQNGARRQLVQQP